MKKVVGPGLGFLVSFKATIQWATVSLVASQLIADRREVSPAFPTKRKIVDSVLRIKGLANPLAGLVF
jgi:hypothetical protein